MHSSYGKECQTSLKENRLVFSFCFFSLRTIQDKYVVFTILVSIEICISQKGNRVGTSPNYLQTKLLA